MSSESPSSPQPSEPSNPAPSPSNNGTSSSSLYLYTFLATLLLLLGISGAIVFRSVLIRRRTRRMIEEAIRNGTWIPPTPRTPVKFGDKPTLHDVYTVLDLQQHNDDPSSLKQKPGIWSAIKPVSASLLTSEKSPHMEPLSLQDDDQSMNPSSPQPFMSRLLRWRKFPPPQSSNALEEASPASPDPAQQYRTATVSVMITMPTQPELGFRTTRTGCPVVTLGIAHVQLPQSWIEQRNSAPSTA